MRKILILVEGQTEETLVRDLLNPHLQAFGKVIVPTILVTKRVKNGPNFKGGITSWARAEKDLRRLLGDSSATAVTTMLDYYGLPLDSPGMKSRQPMWTPYERMAYVEQQMARQIGDPRFIPYLALHEFEALVFASLSQSQWVFNDNAGILEQLRLQMAGSHSPEAINDHPSTSPSRRIARVFPSYQKAVHGPMAVEAAGVAQLRRSCPHFSEWLAGLEVL